MTEFTTCLWFDRQGEEAARFYVDVFPNSRISGVTPYVGGDRDGETMTVDFILNGQKFVALNGGPQFSFDEAISFQIPCADQDEVDHYWNTLTEGGEEGPCGWLKDKFGLSWQVIPTALGELMGDPDPEKAGPVVQAMLGMSKIEVKGLQDAYDGRA